MYHSFLFHSFPDGHLGFFQHLAIVNGAAMNIGVHRLFPTKIRNNTRMSAFTTAIQYSTRSPSHSNKTKKIVNKGKKIKKRHPNWKGGSKTITVCRWNDSLHRKPYRLHQKTRPNKWTWQNSRIQSQYSEISGIFVYQQWNIRNRNRKNIPFDIATRKIKYLGINLTKEVKDLYSENYTNWRKKLRKTQRNGSIHSVHGLEELTSSKCPYYTKHFIDSMQSLLMYQWHISEI